MAREIIIDMQERQERRVAILEDGILEEYYIERVEVHRHIGNICKAKVVNIISGIQAAFVDIGLDKNGFLHVDDVGSSAANLLDEDDDGERPAQKTRAERQISELLKEGQEIVAQVIKEPLGSKGVRLTTNISLAGRLLVLLPYDPQISISRKIEKPDERKRIRQMTADAGLPKGCGLIVRTAADGCTPQEFKRDAEYLINLWLAIEQKIKALQPPVLVHQELDLVFRTIRDAFSEDVSRVVVNDRNEYKEILKFVDLVVPEAKKNIELYEGKEPIFEKWGVQRDIERAFRRRVWLKCGGYIVIDQTEALVAIDVNTGRHTASEGPEDTIFRANVEAADEIARQLRLRNIGGLVVMDFIDMRNKQYQRDLLLRLQNALRKDKAKCSLLPISEFGLVEMTRQRVKESISQSVFDECPYCHGRGMVKSVISVCLDVQRAVKGHFSYRRERDIRIEVHPLVMEAMRENIAMLRLMEEQFRARVTLVNNDRLHVEEYNIFDHRSGRQLETPGKSSQK